MSFELMPERRDNALMSSKLLPPTTDAVVIRRAFPEDVPALARLAALDSRRPLTGDILLAERDGAILAALSLDDGRIAADPFEPTANLIALLRVRARPARRRPFAGVRGRALRGRPAVAQG
jgi:hypothetical protein